MAEVAADEALEVQAPAFSTTTRRAIRGVKRQGSEDPVFIVSKKPLQEAQLSVSPSPTKTFLIRKPPPSFSDRLQKLEAAAQAWEKINSELQSELEDQRQTINKQKKSISELEAESKETKLTISKLESEAKTQHEMMMKMQLRLELMDLENFDLYVGKIGATRRIVAYGILEHVHNEVLSPVVRATIAGKSAAFPTNEKNQYLRFLNKEVFHSKWQQGSYEEVYLAWGAREAKGFANSDIVWLEELLMEAEKELLTKGLESNELADVSATDLRMALGRALSLERHKRNQARHYLSMGEKKVCLDIVEDLMVVMNKGQLSEYKEVEGIMKLGCKLYKSSPPSSLSG